MVDRSEIHWGCMMVGHWAVTLADLKVAVKDMSLDGKLVVQWESEMVSTMASGSVEWMEIEWDKWLVC